MLERYYSEKLIGLQDAIIKKVEEDEKKIEIEIENRRQKAKCPCCGKETDRIHDYRRQKVKDVGMRGKNVILILRKRRYRCSSCGKRFAEANEYLARYQRMTKRTCLFILKSLREVRSYTSVAREYQISCNTVIRLFNYIEYPKPERLPEAIGIDEFKGNTGGAKFNCILTDLKSGQILDILRSRSRLELIEYFKKYDRSGVKYIVSDLYAPYADIVRSYFPKVTYVADKYHWIRQCTWAFEAVRKEIQKKFSKSHRIYFKHSRKLLLKRWNKLKEEEKQQVNVMLYASAELSSSYFLKEQLYSILDMEDRERQCRELASWIKNAEESETKAFVRCAKTYRKWYHEITNSLKCNYSNGFTEGCNNRIKVLKRVSYGLTDFRRFRNRILYTAGARA